jgi:hypothetical protein
MPPINIGEFYHLGSGASILKPPSRKCRSQGVS